MDFSKMSLGIEFGSTRIKAVLIDTDFKTVATGMYDWENKLENGIWTYSEQDIVAGLQGCYANLAASVKSISGEEITSLGSIGISGMMHGYLPFDKNDNLLVPFRTWRNTMTSEASAGLSEVFDFNIPQRWSIAHLYQAILSGEKHVADISYITTLAGFIHYRLSGNKVLGIGEASGVFPIDSVIKNYDRKMLDAFNNLVKDNGYGWTIYDVLPQVLCAGDDAGTLTKEGALFLDPSGKLKEGALLCPPEGDAGTGMTATNAVKVGTGNVSAGTSIFSMIVMDKGLSSRHEEIDMVTTPSGDPVAMVHCNNCSSDINCYVDVADEILKMAGVSMKKDELYAMLYNKALEGKPDCDGLVTFNYYSGEPVVGLNEGKPMLVRKPDAEFNVANLFRSNLYGCMATLKIGMDILTKTEGVKVSSIMGHGGMFKTPVVGQKILSSAINVPVTVMDNANEGGAFGMAVLAAYLINVKAGYSADLAAFLNEKIFAGASGSTIMAEQTDVEGFDKYIENYKAMLKAQEMAGKGKIC